MLTVADTTRNHRVERDCPAFCAKLTVMARGIPQPRDEGCVFHAPIC